MTKYKWKRSQQGLEANIAGKELERIQKKNGCLTPDIIVQEASKKKSPIHSFFEWDDTKAAAQYRLTQARYLLRTIEVVYTESEGSDPVRIRAFHSIINTEDEKEYVTLKQAMDNEDYVQQLKDQATKEIKAWKEKYKAIKDFEAIFQAIDEILL